MLKLRRSRNYRSGYERLGRAVALPFQLLILLVLIPVGILAYPFIGLLILLKGEGSLKQRIVGAVAWPLNVLAMNEFLSLGGLDNPLLSRFTAWLTRLSTRSGKR